MATTADMRQQNAAFDIAGWLSITITGLANFSTQYNFQSIAVALMMMSVSVCTSSDSNCKQGSQATWVESFPSAAVFLGAIVGQLSIGYLGDYMSRSYALAVTMLITSLSAMLTAASSDSTNVPMDIYATIIFFRFTLGIGAGGVYPLTATKAAEDASHTKGKINSKAASWSFFWQMPGLVGPWLVGYFATLNENISTNGKWRLVLGVGAIPPFLCFLLLLWEHRLQRRRRADFDRSVTTARANSATFLNEFQTLRLTISENAVVSTPATTKKASSSPSNLHNSKKAHHSITYTEVIRLIRQDPRIRNRLLVCGGTWFLYNLIVYGLGLLAGDIIFSFNDDDDNISANSSVRRIGAMQMTALSLSTPATLFTIFLLPYTGLKNLQIIGFSLICMTMFFLAIFYYPLRDSGEQDQLFALYCMCSMSLNIGAGITTYALPATLFPKKVRSTFNGIAAAIGKVGAFLGAFTFHVIAEEIGFSWVTGICSFIALVGAIVTTLCINSADILTEDTRESDRLLHMIKPTETTTTNTATPQTSQVPNPMLEEDDDDYDTNETADSQPVKQRLPSNSGQEISMSTFTKTSTSPASNGSKKSPTPSSKYKLDAGFIMDTDDGGDDGHQFSNPILQFSSSSLHQHHDNAAQQGNDDNL